MAVPAKVTLLQFSHSFVAHTLTFMPDLNTDPNILHTLLSVSLV